MSIISPERITQFISSLREWFYKEPDEYVYGFLPKWLEESKLTEHLQRFKDQKLFHKQELANLTEADIEKLGVTVLGERKKILLLISRTRDMLEFVGKISLGGWATIILSLCYVSGYLIHSTFLRTLGIINIPFIKLHFLEVGITFLILSLILSFALTSIYHSFRQLRKSRPGAKPSNIVVTAISFLLVIYLVTLVLFLRYEDWENVLEIGLFSITVRHYTHFYFAFIVLGMATVTKLFTMSDSLNEKGEIQKAKLANFISSILVALCGFITVFTYFLVIYDNDWLWDVIVDMWPYFISLGFLYYVIYKTRKRYQEHYRRFFRTNLIMICSIMSIIFMYMTILSYAHRVYAQIPSNRGGQYPTSTIVLFVKNPAQEIFNEIKSRTTTNCCETKPLFLIEEDEKAFYVTDSFDAFTFLKRPPKVYSILRSEVIAYELIDSLSPRQRKKAVPQEPIYLNRFS